MSSQQIDRIEESQHDQRSDLAVGRRELILGGAALGASWAVGCAGNGDPRNEEGARATASAAPTVAAFELDEVTLDQLREGMESGRWSAARITELYLERIAELDRQGPVSRTAPTRSARRRCAAWRRTRRSYCSIPSAGMPPRSSMSTARSVAARPPST
jgi:amidase